MCDAKYARIQLFPFALDQEVSFLYFELVYTQTHSFCLQIRLQIFWSWSYWFRWLLFCSNVKFGFLCVLKRFYLIWGELIRMYTYHEIQIDDMILFYFFIAWNSC